MKNIVVALLVLAGVGIAIALWPGSGDSPKPNPGNPKAIDITRPLIGNPPRPKPTPQPIASFKDFVPKLPQRHYPAAIVINDNELPAHIDKIVATLNEMLNPDRQATGEQLAALPAAAVPLMRQTLKRDDLSWVAAMALTKGIELIERREAGVQMTPAMAARYEWIRDTIVGAYKRTGQRDEKWDEFVIEALELVALEQSNAPVTHEGNSARILELFTKALDRLCKDPLVMYWYHTKHQNLEYAVPRHHVNGPYEGFVDYMMDLERSDYPPIRKAWGLAKSARIIHETDTTKVQQIPKNTPPTQAVTDLHDRALAEFKKELATGKVPQADAANFALYYLNVAAILGGSRDKAYARVKPLIDAHYPDTGLPEWIDGKFHLDWGYDARGTGYANTVTEEGWRLLRERLERSRTTLLDAMDRYPTQPIYTTPLLSAIMVGRGEPGDLKRCLDHFARIGRGTDQTNQTIAQLAYFLEPKWGGSWEQVLTLGRQCLLTGNWEDHLPMVLLDAHLSIARAQAPEGDDDLLLHTTYLRHPEVWKDIQFVCQNMLHWFPGDRAVLSKYLIGACAVQDWKLARGLIEELNDVPDFRYLNGPSFQGMRMRIINIVDQPIAITDEQLSSDDKLRELMANTHWHHESFSDHHKMRRRYKYIFNKDGTTNDEYRCFWRIENSNLITYPEGNRNARTWTFNKSAGRWEHAIIAGNVLYLIPIGTK